MTMEKEIWVPINENYQNYSRNGWESERIVHIKPIYEISNIGRMRNKNTKKIISTREENKVTLSAKDRFGCNNRLTFSVARIYHQTFNGPLEHYQRVKFVQTINTKIY